MIRAWISRLGRGQVHLLGADTWGPSRLWSSAAGSGASGGGPAAAAPPGGLAAELADHIARVKPNRQVQQPVANRSSTRSQPQGRRQRRETPGRNQSGPQTATLVKISDGNAAPSPARPLDASFSSTLHQNRWLRVSRTISSLRYSSELRLSQPDVPLHEKAAVVQQGLARLHAISQQTVPLPVIVTILLRAAQLVQHESLIALRGTDLGQRALLDNLLPQLMGHIEAAAAAADASSSEIVQASTSAVASSRSLAGSSASAARAGLVSASSRSASANVAVGAIDGGKTGAAAAQAGRRLPPASSPAGAAGAAAELHFGMLATVLSSCLHLGHTWDKRDLERLAHVLVGCSQEATALQLATILHVVGDAAALPLGGEVSMVNFSLFTCMVSVSRSLPVWFHFSLFYL